MNLKNKRIGYAMTGSFCNFKSSILELKKLVDSEAKIVPIMSSNAYNTNTKFGTAKSFVDEIEEITGQKILHKIEEVEPLGPKNLIDILIIAPCTRKHCWKISKWNIRYTCCTSS